MINILKYKKKNNNQLAIILNIINNLNDNYNLNFETFGSYLIIN